jgi:hypothetical protein
MNATKSSLFDKMAGLHVLSGLHASVISFVSSKINTDSKEIRKSPWSKA